MATPSIEKESKTTVTVTVQTGSNEQSPGSLGGYIQVFGQRNLKKTRKVLEGAGFLAEEDGAVF